MSTARCGYLVAGKPCRLTENDLIHHKTKARAAGFDEELFPDTEFHDYAAMEESAQ